MAVKYKHKNLLPLLAITTLLLSVGLVKYNDTLILNSKNTQSVLSDTDENKSDDEDHSKIENDKKDEDVEKREEVKKETKNRTQELRKDTVRVVQNEKGRDVKPTEKPKSKIEIVEVEDNSEDESEDINDNSDETENEIEIEKESESVADDGTLTKFKLKIKTRTVAGKTIVETSAGEVEVENSPEDSINSLVEDSILDVPLSFEAKTNDKNEVEFEIQGTEERKLFGFINLNLPKTVTVNSTTGEVLSTKQDVWNQFLRILSI